MILFNTTFIVDNHAVEPFKVWVSTDFIPQALQTGFMTDHMLCSIIPPEGMPDDGSCSFALHLRSDSLESARKWADETASALAARFRATHGAESLLTFSTFMEIL
ncbi:MAG: DUF4286 family protein [Bacteroides sp.]|nr:DUF4286 family protein [Bacteroides sp.]MCM1413132.1 DUF4286 family protein [Bacteroides sp.]MCM1472126.1 DUF4286 family protein [Bacteroides sp.]